MAVALCTVTAAATGCGSQSTSLAAADAARLHQDVAGIRSAAAHANPQAAVAAVKTLQSDVTRLQTTGKLAQADAAVLLSDAGQVAQRVALEVHMPASHAPAPPTPVPPVPAPPGQGGPHGNAHGKHKGDHGSGGGGDGGD
jgi:hypothetical protein